MAVALAFLDSFYLVQCSRICPKWGFLQGGIIKMPTVWKSQVNDALKCCLVRRLTRFYNRDAYFPTQKMRSHHHCCSSLHISSSLHTHLMH